MKDALEGNAVYDVLKESRNIEPHAKAIDWQLSDIIAKSVEELGELSTAVLIRQGKITNKGQVTDDDIIAEGADVTICVLDALSRALPERSPSEIYTLFLYFLSKKSKKWRDKYIKS